MRSEMKTSDGVVKHFKRLHMFSRFNGVDDCWDGQRFTMADNAHA